MDLAPDYLTLLHPRGFAQNFSVARMIERDAIRDLQAFIDERWAAAQPKCAPHATEGWCLTPKGKVPPFAEAITPREAASFLASVATNGSEPPLLVVHDNNKLHRDDRALVSDGEARARVRMATRAPCLRVADRDEKWN